jgi:hypothetical protein
MSARFIMERCSRVVGEGVVYPSVHFFHRQAAREKLAAMRALTEAARERHLALALDYKNRAEQLRSATA